MPEHPEIERVQPATGDIDKVIGHKVVYWQVGKVSDRQQNI